MDFLIELVNSNWSCWPVVSLIIFAMLEHYHHGAISNLIGRIKHIKFNRDCFEVSGEIKQQELSQSGNDDVRLEDKEGKEESIKESTENNANSNMQHYEEMKRRYEFERIYNAIYRSQIQMMQEIKINNNRPMPYQYSYSFFEFHLQFLNANNRNENPALYFQWLESTNLVKGTNDGYILTEFGLEFLSYIYENNYNINLKIL